MQMNKEQVEVEEEGLTHNITNKSGMNGWLWWQKSIWEREKEMSLFDDAIRIICMRGLW